MRILRTEFFHYLYDPIAEGALTGELPASQSTDGVSNIGFVTPNFLGSQIIASRPINVLSVEAKDVLYQGFIGIAPSPVRLYTNIPATASQRRLEVVSWSSAYPAAGWVDGYASPLFYPAPSTQIILVNKIDIQLGFANPLQFTVRPLLLFYLTRAKFGVVSDIELIMEMLDKRGRGVNTKIVTVGGLTSFDYPYLEVFGIRPIPLSATREEVRNYISPR
ncbi:MAG: hypothetical protein QW304_07805 [Thermoproteota archaeon]